MVKVLRPNKNGGFSVCSSPEELVGKGRCNHLNTGKYNSEIVYDKETKSYFVDVAKYDRNNKEDSKKKESRFKKFLIKCKSDLDNNKRETIIKHLKENNF